MNRLQESSRKSVGGRTVFSRKRRPSVVIRETILALLNVGLGAGLLVALLQLPSRLDSLLIFSKVISTLIAGLSQIGLGLMALGTGLLQMIGILLLLGMALMALMLVGNGAVRLLRMLLPGLGGIWQLPGGVARLVWSVVRIRAPDRPER